MSPQSFGLSGKAPGCLGYNFLRVLRCIFPNPLDSFQPEVLSPSKETPRVNLIALFAGVSPICDDAQPQASAFLWDTFHASAPLQPILWVTSMSSLLCTRLRDQDEVVELYSPSRCHLSLNSSNCPSIPVTLLNTATLDTGLATTARRRVSAACHLTYRLLGTKEGPVVCPWSKV